MNSDQKAFAIRIVFVIFMIAGIVVLFYPFNNVYYNVLVIPIWIIGVVILNIGIDSISPKKN